MAISINTKKIGSFLNSATFEQHESIDDNLLPDADELVKLQQVDNTIIPWLKDRAVKEQDARHQFNDRRMGLLEDGQRRNFLADLVAMSFSFIIIMASMGFSYFLIQAQHVITGTIFAGGTIVWAVSSFNDESFIK